MFPGIHLDSSVKEYLYRTCIGWRHAVLTIHIVFAFCDLKGACGLFFFGCVSDVIIHPSLDWASAEDAQPKLEQQSDR